MFLVSASSTIWLKVNVCVHWSNIVHWKWIIDLKFKIDHEKDENLDGGQTWHLTR